MKASAEEEIIDRAYRSLGLRSPIEVLRDCIKQKEWFKGIVLSTAFFEGVGERLLSAHFKETISPDKIENLRSVEKIIILLFASGIIDQPIYTKMIEVNDFRNDIVHLRTLEAPTDPKLQPKKAERIIEKAIACLQDLCKRILKVVMTRAFGEIGRNGRRDRD